MTQEECIANLKRIENMVWALRESCIITKENLRFPPDVLLTAIGLLYMANQELKTAIDKLTKKVEKEMKIKSALKFIGNELLLIFALTVFIGLVTVLGTVAIILLSMLGLWIGIDKDIFIYVAAFYIFGKAWDVLTWVVDRIADKIERKKEREYFGQLNKEQ